MATLTVTISESVTLNGRERGSEIVNDYAVTEVFHRIVSCPSGVDTTVAVFKESADDADGALDVEDVKYIRVTNLDSTNPINLSLQIDAGEDNSAADESATVLVPAGESFIMGGASDSIAVDDTNANIVTDLHNLESLLVDPLAQTVKVEVFIAS